MKSLVFVALCSALGLSAIAQNDNATDGYDDFLAFYLEGQAADDALALRVTNISNITFADDGSVVITTIDDQVAIAPDAMWQARFEQREVTPDTGEGEGETDPTDPENPDPAEGEDALQTVFAGADRIVVTTIGGRVLTSVTSEADLQCGQVPAGVYIIKRGNKTYKEFLSF